MTAAVCVWTRVKTARVEEILAKTQSVEDLRALRMASATCWMNGLCPTSSRRAAAVLEAILSNRVVEAFRFAVADSRILILPVRLARELVMAPAEAVSCESDAEVVAVDAWMEKSELEVVEARAVRLFKVLPKH